MSLELLSFLAPLIGVLLFFTMERIILKDKRVLKNRIRTIFGIETLNLLFSFFLSSVVLIPLVFLLAPQQLFSFTNLDVPRPVSFAVSFLFLDFINYTQHVLHHKVPLLWRVHRLHHTDPSLDSLTAILHHPLEILSGFLITISFAVIFDIPVIVIVIYALVAGMHSPFTHFKKLVPEKIEKYFRYILITPNFHRIHHSVNFREQNSNFGIVFIFWDKIFGTFMTKDNDKLRGMEFGVDKNQHSVSINLLSFISNPFNKR